MDAKKKNKNQEYDIGLGQLETLQTRSNPGDCAAQRSQDSKTVDKAGKETAIRVLRNISIGIGALLIFSVLFVIGGSILIVFVAWIFTVTRLLVELAWQVMKPGLDLEKLPR